jgi:hypothetical protein
MTNEQLIQEVRRGRLVLVGEFRGAVAEKRGFVDQISGKAIRYIRAVHLIECACLGRIGRAVVYQRLPETIEKPEEVVFPYEKGKQYVYFITSCKNERGQVVCHMGERAPELLEDTDSGGRSVAVSAPVGADTATSP